MKLRIMGLMACVFLGLTGAHGAEPAQGAAVTFKVTYEKPRPKDQFATAAVLGTYGYSPTQAEWTAGKNGEVKVQWPQGSQQLPYCVREQGKEWFGDAKGDAGVVELKALQMTQAVWPIRVKPVEDVMTPPPIEVKAETTPEGDLKITVQNNEETALEFRWDQLQIYSPLIGLVPLSRDLVKVGAGPGMEEQATVNPNTQGLTVTVDWKACIKKGRWFPYGEDGLWVTPKEDKKGEWFAVRLMSARSKPVDLILPGVKKQPTQAQKAKAKQDKLRQAGVTFVLLDGEGKPAKKTGVQVQIGSYGYTAAPAFRAGQWEKQGEPGVVEINGLEPGVKLPYLLTTGAWGSITGDLMLEPGQTRKEIRMHELNANANRLPELKFDLSKQPNGTIRVSITSTEKGYQIIRWDEVKLYNPMVATLSLSPDVVKVNGGRADDNGMILDEKSPTTTFEIDWDAALEKGRWMPAEMGDVSWPTLGDGPEYGPGEWFRISVRRVSSLPIKVVLPAGKPKI